MLGPADTAEQRESVSLAMLLLMERLAPNERVVYVLREAFGYPHREIAEILDLSESNCQQIYRRAKQHVTGRSRARSTRPPLGRRRGVPRRGPQRRHRPADPAARRRRGRRRRRRWPGPGRKTPVLGALEIARYLTGAFRPTAPSAASRWHRGVLRLRRQRRSRRAGAVGERVFAVFASTSPRTASRRSTSRSTPRNWTASRAGGWPRARTARSSDLVTHITLGSCQGSRGCPVQEVSPHRIGANHEAPHCRPRSRVRRSHRRRSSRQATAPRRRPDHPRQRRPRLRRTRTSAPARGRSGSAPPPAA